MRHPNRLGSAPEQAHGRQEFPTSARVKNGFWHSQGGPDEAGNALALCSLHQVLFDLGAIGLNADFSVRVSPDYVARSEQGEWLRSKYMSCGRNGEMAMRPSSESNRLSNRAMSNIIVAIHLNGIWVETLRSSARRFGPQLVPAWIVVTAWRHIERTGSSRGAFLKGSTSNGRPSSLPTARFPDVTVRSTRPIVIELSARSQPKAHSLWSVRWKLVGVDDGPKFRPMTPRNHPIVPGLDFNRRQQSDPVSVGRSHTH